MTEEHDKDRLFVTALARGLTVLSAFRSGESGLSNQELARRTGLPKSTVSRLTHTLTQLGYLSHEADSGFYRLGLAVLELGSVVLASYDIRRAAAPLMREFALANNVSVSLAMRDGSDMVYLETCRSGARVSVQLTVGSRVPVATTAIGRAYYVGLGATDRARLDGELATRYDGDWPDIKTRLDAALAHYRQHGFTSSFGEFVPEVMAVGVPLPSPIPGQPPMSLNASGPAALFTAERFERDIAPALQEMARRIVPGAA
ncbi:MAG: IclR family transcriptional regulator [Pseudogulbenkiania sp.]|nr:IclR family transcriptional regulator [Pseudogulbenkiania sp.]